MKTAILLCIASCFLLLACNNPQAGGDLSLTGKFRSVRAVMDPLSCYCANGGYLSTADGKEIPLCLKNEMEPDCVEMMVEGKMTRKQIEPEATSPCPGGEMEYLMVRKFECK